MPHRVLHLVKNLFCTKFSTIKTFILKLSQVISSKSKSRTVLRLTGSIGADVDDLALCSVDLMFIRSRELGLHHDGILRPRLQRQYEVSGLLLVLSVGGARWRIHVCYDPAVRAARVLPVKLGHVSVWPGEDGRC